MNGKLSFAKRFYTYVIATYNQSPESKVNFEMKAYIVWVRDSRPGCEPFLSKVVWYQTFVLFNSFMKSQRYNEMDQNNCPCMSKGPDNSLESSLIRVREKKIKKISTLRYHPIKKKVTYLNWKSICSRNIKGELYA